MVNNLHLLVLEKFDFGFMFKNSLYFPSFARILECFFFFGDVFKVVRRINFPLPC